LDATSEKRMRVGGDGIGQLGVTTQAEVVNIGFRPGQYDRDRYFGSFMCDWGWSRMVMRRKFCGNADLRTSPGVAQAAKTVASWRLVGHRDRPGKL
jgi:hypothetical protein